MKKQKAELTEMQRLVKYVAHSNRL